MKISGVVHTSSEKHSVKEAVISFVCRPIISDAHKYKKLVGADEMSFIKENYQQFEPINQVSMRFTNGQVPQVEKSFSSGFKLIGFQNGEVTNVIQGVNQPNNAMFTFNTLRYENWNDFFPFVVKAAKEIANFDTNFIVLAYNLIYIDEFHFDVNDEYNANKIFNGDSNLLPGDIFQSNFVDFNINLNKNKENHIYQEQLAIKVFSEGERKRINITENLFFPSQSIQLKELLDDERFLSDMNFAHVENKMMLCDVLKDNIAKSIKVKV